MIDTIRAYLSLNELGLTANGIQQLLAPITRKVMIINDGIRMLGDSRLKFSFEIQHNKLILVGSLCKFYKGNNLNTLSYQEIRHALIKLERLTNLPIGQFIVSRLDISDNVLTNRPVSNYLSVLAGIDRHKGETYKVREESTGKYFSQTKKTILVYDKYKEHKMRQRKYKNGRTNTVNSGSVTHEYFQENGKNVLRFEFRLTRQVGQQLGLKELRINDLTNRQTHEKLVRIWFVNFMKIEHKTDIHFWPEDIKTVRQASALFLRLGIEYLGGFTAVVQMLRQASKNKEFGNKNQCTRLVRRVKAIGKDNSCFEVTDNQLYAELRKKITYLALVNLGHRSRCY